MRKVATLSAKKGWLSDKPQSGFFKANDEIKKSGDVELKVELSKIQKVIAKELKPGRKLVSVVKFADGRMEEAVESHFQEPKKEDPKKEEPKAGTTVAKPRLGCPEPRLARAELKARSVLEVFLDSEQIADFRDHNQFISIGADTGHRYMITSRHNREGLRQFHRQLHDLDENNPFCVHHDALVPAAEEMLTLHLLLQFPHHERYLRGLEAQDYGPATFGQVHG